MSKRIFTGLIALIFVIATSQVAFATDYAIELVVPDGKESKETDAVLRINEDSFQVLIEKAKFKQHEKNFRFSDIKIADYSYSKKPMLSGGGAVATALLVGFIFALPFLFIKKKNHWLTIQAEKEFAVMKLGGNNYRAIQAEFETHGVKVNEVKEEAKEKK
ncbi:MAG TPA: hypothetical protein PKO33_13005 [Pyrinomonadaceae bacterium]|nr:hypothetical protein [Pyrinomonadaceae bacterium]